MIDRERWLEALKGSPTEDTEGAMGFHLPPHGSLVLHEEEARGEAMGGRGAGREAGRGAGEGGEATLMRLVCEEATRDTAELLMQARKLDEYVRARKSNREGGEEGLSLPLYASATPNGRLVVNFCACSPFDETLEAVAALDRFLADNPLGVEATR